MATAKKGITASKGSTSVGITTGVYRKPTSQLSTEQMRKIAEARSKTTSPFTKTSITKKAPVKPPSHLARTTAFKAKVSANMRARAAATKKSVPFKSRTTLNRAMSASKRLGAKKGR